MSWLLSSSKWLPLRLTLQNAGIVQVAVSYCPSISAKLYGQAVEELNVELSQLMTRLLCACPTSELESYCIIPGESVWHIASRHGVWSSGNLPDIISMAIYAALNDTIFPSVRPVGVEGEKKTIEVDVDPVAGKLMMAHYWLICATLSKVGDYFITDPLQEEELYTTAQISVAVTPDGRVCGVKKSGSGVIEMRAWGRTGSPVVPESVARTGAVTFKEAVFRVPDERSPRINLFKYLRGRFHAPHMLIIPEPVQRNAIHVLLDVVLLDRGHAPPGLHYLSHDTLYFPNNRFFS
ncbi:hypothetical protein PsorP6_017556 [Peronosclerospora sorghi]|uniref:Uncharacterized protein n=1 Tax=Peronosclerospora sorghi TaxID=230839 RepID=A0ACC0WP95_9STRA|nr:hypothetical protein PsorP6_017556 [Peronosclerospora sorghi]